MAASVVYAMHVAPPNSDAATYVVAAHGQHTTWNAPVLAKMHVLDQRATAYMQQMQQFVSPPLPGTLTAGLPVPADVIRQKTDYEKMLDEQMAQLTAALEQQRRQHLDCLHSQAEQCKQQVLTQIAQQVQEQKQAVMEQHAWHMAELNKQCAQLKNAVEQQAIEITGDYLQRELQARRCELDLKFAADMQMVQAQEQATRAQLHSCAAHPLFAMSSAPRSIACAAAEKLVAPAGSYVPPPMMLSGTASRSYTPAVAVGALNEAFAFSYGSPMTELSQTWASPYTLPPIGSHVVPMPEVPASLCTPMPLHQVGAGPTGSYVPPPMRLPEAVGAGSDTFTALPMGSHVLPVPGTSASLYTPMPLQHGGWGSVLTRSYVPPPSSLSEGRSRSYTPGVPACTSNKAVAGPHAPPVTEFSQVRPASHTPPPIGSHGPHMPEDPVSLCTSTPPQPVVAGASTAGSYVPPPTRLPQDGLTWHTPAASVSDGSEAMPRSSMPGVAMRVGNESVASLYAPAMTELSHVRAASYTPPPTGCHTPSTAASHAHPPLISYSTSNMSPVVVTQLEAHVHRGDISSCAHAPTTPAL